MPHVCIWDFKQNFKILYDYRDYEIVNAQVFAEHYDLGSVLGAGM